MAKKTVQYQGRRRVYTPATTSADNGANLMCMWSNAAGTMTSGAPPDSEVLGDAAIDSSVAGVPSIAVVVCSNSRLPGLTVTLHKNHHRQRGVESVERGFR